MKLRVLIADDEALCRQRLRHFLQEEPQTEIVAECTTGLEALDAIRQTSPELVFLDVKMPDLDGFAVLQELKGAQVPVIVFVTAHDRFAVRAFDVHAVDYLLKPFDRGRFQTAFGRAVDRLHSVLGGRGTTGSGPSALEPVPSKGLDRVAVKSNGRISLVQTAEIDWVSAADNYSILHVAKATHILRMTLKDLEGQLPKEQFLRIGRSRLVNLERIKEIRPKSHGDASVVLRDGTILPTSRKYRRNLLNLFASLH
jgi:two-component system LytT family response regulator